MTNESQPNDPDTGGSISQWIQQVQDGHSMAAQQLWQRYVERLVRLASRKLGSRPKRAADEEDVALSAFHAFLEGVRHRRYPKLEDREDLWQILVMLTERKAISQLRRELAEKRGAGNVRGDSIFMGSPDASGQAGIGEIADLEPSPEMAVMLHDQLQVLLNGLSDDTQRRIVLGKLSGMQNRELAAELGISLRSVERKLRLIRRRWQGTSPT